MEKRIFDDADNKRVIYLCAVIVTIIYALVKFIIHM